MATFRTEPPGQKPQEEKKYPPTIDLRDGTDVVAMAVNIRPGVPTKWGPKDVIEVVTPDAEDIVKSLWWPKKLPQPPLCTPFFLARIQKGEYYLDIPGDYEAQARLWRGEKPVIPAKVEKDAPAAPVVPDLASQLINRFRK